MEKVELELSDGEFSTVSSMSTADAAIEICRIHFRRVDARATFPPPAKGADLRIRFPNGAETDIEVKGTEKVGLAWNQFKVSSQQSHDLLMRGIPLIGSQKLVHAQSKFSSCATALTLKCHPNSV